ncbi:MAG: glutamine--tRNA ligase, partial [Spirochaetae bacterium HGW-Spirochaetae-6]
ASGNINMRDPVLYRIQRSHHHRTGDKWLIYPMYDFAHGQSDSLEGITHSVCTLEFEDHRPLYDWFIDQLEIHHPQQIEFARLNLTYTVLSKRKLRALVEGGYVSGWDDPRMPTLSGLRRRGYSPEGIKKFCEMIGVSKSNSTVDIAMLEFAQREDLNKRARRVMAVLDPIKLIITNYPEGQEEYLDASNNPEDESMGSRKLPFSRELYIEREDFMETPSKKFHRLAPGQEVRLKFAYYITAGEVTKDAQGNITAVTCTYDPATKGGWSQDGRKVKGTIHWVSVPHAKKAEVRLYDYLFSKENPEETEEGQDFTHFLNPGSLQVSFAYVEPGLL